MYNENKPLRDAVFALEGNDYDDESRSDESTKIFNEVPRETPRQHILLLIRNIFNEVPRETRCHQILLLNLKIFDEVPRETPRQHILLLNLKIFDEDIVKHLVIIFYF